MKRDFAPWLLLPCIMTALGSVTLLVPHQAAQAASPTHTQPAPQAAPVYEDGDGDELLEHWGDPAYSHEERLQLGGIAAGFLLLGGTGLSQRRRKRLGVVVRLPQESDFLKQRSDAEANSQSSSRKAA